MYAVASCGDGPEAMVADRFGRAQFFAFFDEGGRFLRSVENDTSSSAHGAGGQAVALVASEGAKVVIGPQFGVNAESAMKAGEISGFSASGCTVSEAVSRCISGDLKKLF